MSLRGTVKVGPIEYLGLWWATMNALMAGVFVLASQDQPWTLVFNVVNGMLGVPLWTYVAVRIKHACGHGSGD